MTTTLTESELEELTGLCEHSLASSTKPKLSNEVSELVLNLIKEVRRSRALPVQWRSVLRHRASGRLDDPEEAESFDDARDHVEYFLTGEPNPDHDPAEWECVIQHQIGGGWHDHSC